MRLDIQSRSFPLTDAVRLHVERRIHSALDRVLPRIADVEVRLADVNGPKGGTDKHCGILVRLTDGRTIVLRERDSCAYRAVDRVTTRMKRLVKEKLKEGRARRRGRESIRRDFPLDDRGDSQTPALVA